MRLGKVPAVPFARLPTARYALALLALAASESHAKPSVEVHDAGGPQAIAARQWLQRLADAGAGTTRLVASPHPDGPSIVELGRTAAGKPIVKVHAALSRRGELLLPAPGGGVERYRVNDTRRLETFFARLEAGAAAGVTAARGKYGLTEAEFTDLFTRLSTPLGEHPKQVTLAEVAHAAARRARVRLTIDPAIARVADTPSTSHEPLSSLATGTALAVLAREHALAIQPTVAPGEPVTLRLVSIADAPEDDRWPIGYEPEGSPRETAPALFDTLRVEVSGYSVEEAIAAIAPRLTWQEGPLPVVWDRFALRRDGVDPAERSARLAPATLGYKRLLDKLAFQARCRVELRVDEAGRPFLWLTR